MMLSVKPAGMMMAAAACVLVHLLAGGRRVGQHRWARSVGQVFGDWKTSTSALAQLAAVLVDQDHRDVARPLLLPPESAR